MALIVLIVMTLAYHNSIKDNQVKINLRNRNKNQLNLKVVAIVCIHQLRIADIFKKSKILTRISQVLINNHIKITKLLIKNQK